MEKILIGKAEEKIYIDPAMLNRHGLIAGATGTGKTVTLKVLAEALSDRGIPCFLADVKGDLASLAMEGEVNDKIQERLKILEVEDFEPSAYPVEFWDLFQENGLPIRTSISEMGPLSLSRLLGLNETQEGVLNIAFTVADDNGLLLLDIKDLRAVLNFVQENSKELSKVYGNISSQSIGAILRSILVLENEGADLFFTEPSLDLKDFFKTNGEGKGYINILAAEKLMKSPKLYSTFLFWMLSELYENLEEVGDLEAPKFVFFFDEAHLLFEDNNKVLLEQIELITRLIRSKGVSVFFITQNPSDLPEKVLAQIGNKIQHALRAYTPKEKKAVKACADSFRQKDDENLEEVILNLGVGEALVSSLDEDGVPTYAEKTTIMPPKSSFASLEAAKRVQIINQSNLLDKYQEVIDRESAYEILLKKQEEVAQEKEPEAKEEKGSILKTILESQSSNKSTRRTDSNFDRFTKNLFSQVGREVGRMITRGIFGNLKR